MSNNIKITNALNCARILANTIAHDTTDPYTWRQADAIRELMISAAAMLDNTEREPEQDPYRAGYNAALDDLCEIFKHEQEHRRHAD